MLLPIDISNLLTHDQWSLETIPFSIKICVIAHKTKGKTLDNWLHFCLSERVLAEVVGCRNYFALTHDLTEHVFSNVERDVYEVFIIGI